jgi:integral membrane protein
MRRLLDKGLPGALLRYQLMANIVGTLIVPLFIFTGIKIATGHCKLEVEIFGVTHGYLYIVYLITVGILSFKARLNVLWILVMCGAGLLPGLTFVVERWVVTRKIHPLLASSGGVEAFPQEARPST